MRFCSWAGWMNGWFLALVTVGLACLGVCHRAQGQPLSEPLYVSVDPSLALSSEELCAAIATELGLEPDQVRAADAAQVQGALIEVTVPAQNQLRVSYRDAAGARRERTIDKSTDRQNNLRMVTWLVGNLVRNQGDMLDSKKEPDVVAAKPSPQKKKPTKKAAEQTPSAAASSAISATDAAPWLISARAGASFWSNMLGGHLGLAVSYRWPYVALGTELQFTAGSLSDVFVTREQTITSPSLEEGYQNGSFFAFTWPVFAGLHFDIRDVSLGIGAGPGLRVTYLSVENMSGITVEPVLHSYVELAVNVNKGFRVALRPFVNYAFSGQRVASFEETQITEPTIVDSSAIIDPLIEGGMSLGLQWSY